MKTLTSRQLDGRACVVCGRHDQPMQPIYVETPASTMVFACTACPRPSESEVRQQIAASVAAKH